MSNSKIIFENSIPDRTGFSLPPCDVPQKAMEETIPSELLRSLPVKLPELSEPQVVRHFINLSTKNHHVDKDFYPLGSCTMKYNPKINDAMASLPGFSNIHPNQPEDSIQGALHIIYTITYQC